MSLTSSERARLEALAARAARRRRLPAVPADARRLTRRRVCVAVLLAGAAGLLGLLGAW